MPSDVTSVLLDCLSSNRRGGARLPGNPKRAYHRALYVRDDGHDVLNCIVQNCAGYDLHRLILSVHLRKCWPDGLDLRQDVDKDL